MAFDICGPTTRCAIGPGEEEIFSLPARFGLPCPTLARLSQRFYADTVLRGGEVAQLQREIAGLQDAYMEELMQRKAVTATDPSVRARIRSELAHQDRLCRLLDAIREVCEEALSAGGQVRCAGD